MKKLTATIKTKSNFRNLNGQTLEVVEIVGTRVSCYITEVFTWGTSQIIADFTIKEVTLNY